MAFRSKDELLHCRNNETEELLVFGYSCKLFRDDEKALYIDQGKHLIPWMGDDSLKIDRYDARGTLYDLKQAEAPSGGFDRHFGFTDIEKQVEAMCDEERYRALITNEEEETLYQEEELKRFHHAINDKKNFYSQVEYKYSGISNEIKENTEEKIISKSEDTIDDEPFVPSSQLDLPVNMIVPETTKHNAIIEKTAMFISDQGPQMEILLKMKQAENPQFNFLSYDNPLHNYYRHLLVAIKNGHYKPNLLDNSNKKSDTDNDNDEDEHYLHPSLASSVSKVELAPSIPSINYKPSAHCAYSMLVNKIKDKKCNEEKSCLYKIKEAFENLSDDKRRDENETDLENSHHHYLISKPHEIPPKDLQLIIDKMASYVAKNGKDFEAVVQMKNDPRFDFLKPSHIYNQYYQFKVKKYECIEKMPASETATKMENYLKSKEESKIKVTPVCFSIKKPKDSEPVIEKSALPVEESSDEDERHCSKERECKEAKEKETKEEIITIDLAAQEDKEEKNKKIIATEKLKDRLSAAAREKIAMASREKQLQIVRKKRAAMFLRKIVPEPIDKDAIFYGPQLPDSKAFSGGEEDRTGKNSLSDTSKKISEKAKSRLSKTGCEHERNAEFSSESRHSGSNLGVKCKHREKRKSESKKLEDNLEESFRRRELNDRFSDSSTNNDDDERKSSSVFHEFKSRRSQDGSGGDVWVKKYSRNKSIEKEEKRHKRKKYKRNDVKDRSSRKHSKLKKHERFRENYDSRYCRSKKSRTNSVSCSDRGSDDSD